MTTPLTVANRQTITAQIANLDFQISKLSVLFNANHYKSGSLVLSGSGTRSNNFAGYKTFHEIIAWPNNVPKKHVQKFLQLICEDLIYQRTLLLTLLENGIQDFRDQTRLCNCSHCSRPTLQRNYFILPGSDSIIIPTDNTTWICNECESLII